MIKIFLCVLIFAISQVVSKSSVFNDEVCDRQINLFDDALEKREHWALYMFDTWAKLPSGIFRGNLNTPGSFTDCVNIRHESNVSNVATIQGQHCMVNFQAMPNATEIETERQFDWMKNGEIARLNGLSFQHGFCLPASCSSQKVIEYTSGYFSNDGFIGASAKCVTNDPIRYEALDIFAIVIFTLLGLLLLLSTIYEIYMVKSNCEPNPLFASFSVYTNSWKLYDVTLNKSPNDIRCLHGIRSLSILYIIFGHRYGIPLSTAISNRAAIAEWSTHFHIGIYHTHQVPVDVFFMLGGLLAVWSMLRNLDANRFNILRMYLHRYLRYTPLLAAIIFFLVTLMKHIVFGPFSYLETRASMLPNCEKWWWTSLLHVANYVNPNEICLGHSWYLSVDFQLYLITPFLIYPAWKYGWKYLWTLPTLTLMSSIYIFVMSLVYKIWIVTKTEDAASFNFFIKWIYYPTHARMGPWFIGMTLGYILYQNKGKTVRLNPILNGVMWIVSLTIFMAVTMGSQIMFLPAAINETTLLANAIYLAFYRNSWALATAWMVFACHNETGGIIRWFLQLPQWQPIARMGLSLYLLGFMYQHFIVMNIKVPIYFDEFEMIHQFWGDMVASIFLSTIGYLTFEVPFLTVENFIYNKIQARKNKEKV